MSTTRTILTRGMLVRKLVAGKGVRIMNYPSVVSSSSYLYYNHQPSTTILNRSFSSSNKESIQSTVNQQQQASSSSTGAPEAATVAASQASSTTDATTATAAATSTAAANTYARTKDRGPVSWTSLFLVGVAAASAVTYYQIERERRLERAMGKVVSSESDGWTPRPDYLAKRKFVPTKYGWFPMADAFGAPGKPAIGGPWTAIDLDGNFVTNKSFEGKWLLLYFGFARCPDICPSEMQKVGRVMDTLKADHPELAKDIIPIFVSIDPARDSLKALKEYAKDFHPSYIFLTGSPTQIRDMAKKYRVYFSKAEESPDGDYLVDHSIVIYFHDNTGDLADCFTQSMRPTDLVEKIVERMTATPSIQI